MKRSPWILGCLLLAGTAHAQTDQSQLVQPPAASQLNSNLARLAANPRDVEALIGAGEAALSLNDPRAATGFFARADAVDPSNGRIKAGLARVMLQLQNPVEAVRLFDLAARLGYPDTTILSDRGLAKDMTGDQAGAQRDYQAALQRTPGDDELVRRYAASLGISGQVDAADHLLKPLLYKSDRAAWRYRAFILAMNNRQSDAKKIADQTMPAQLAAAIVPYMQKMPYLTAAQKAAAVHFGHFPQQIGTSIVAVIPTPPAPGIAVTPPASPQGVVTLAAADTRRSGGSARTGTRQDRADPPGERIRRQRAASQLAQAEKPPVAATSQSTATALPTPAPSAGTPSVPERAIRTPVLSAPASSAPAAVAHSATPHLSQVQPVRQAASEKAASTSADANASADVQPQPPVPRPAQQASAVSTLREVQGPPAPGFESMDRPATPTAPGAGGQANGAALAQATPPRQVAETAPVAEAALAAGDTAPAKPQQPDPVATRTLADIIRAIDVPETERRSNVAAVDLDEVARIQAARAVAKKAAATAAAEKAKQAEIAKAKAEAAAQAEAEAEEKKRLAANPARNWLQVGVGQGKSALAFTMKGLRKKYASLAHQDAWSASWGRTNRLLVGPFSSFARAQELAGKLKADGADVFAWKSEAGEIVETLAGD